MLPVSSFKELMEYFNDLIEADMIEGDLDYAVAIRLHSNLGRVLGLSSPTPTSPLTASAPAKNPRRVNGGL